MKKKTLSVFIALCFFLNMSVFTAYAQNEVSYEDDGYVSFDMETGAVEFHSYDDVPDAIGDASCATTPGYNPNGVAEIDGVMPAAIVGGDNRVRVYNTTTAPFCYTVSVTSTFDGGAWLDATGVLIGPSTVLTAAHCVFNSEYGGAAESVTIIPGRNGEENPYGSTTTTSTNIHISNAFLQLDVNGASYSLKQKYDWAIVELDSPIGNQAGWASMRWQAESYDSTAVYNMGYPNYGTVGGQNEDSSYMFYSIGMIEDSDTLLLSANFDATGGHSGGPVMGTYSGEGYVLIGILVSGSAESTNGSTYPTAYSTVVRITESMYNMFVQYI